MWDWKTIKETSIFILLGFIVFLGSAYITTVVVDYTGSWSYVIILPLLLMLYIASWIKFVEL